jgi:hypothetical protein
MAQPPFWYCGKSNYQSQTKKSKKKKKTPIQSPHPKLVPTSDLTPCVDLTAQNHIQTRFLLKVM